MAKWCIATLTTANHFQYYIPMFVYTAKKAYPDAFVRVYVMGELKPDVRALLEEMKKLRPCNTDWSISENAFIEYPMSTSLPNSLRQLLPEKDFKEFEYLYVLDSDVLLFPCEPTHLGWFKSVIKATGQPIACFRGPIRAKSNKLKCVGSNSRVACICYLLQLPQWWDKTAEARKNYLGLLKTQQLDSHKDFIPGSFRESDEIMLHRIMEMSGMPTPGRPGEFINGVKLPWEYRGIHIGDFKFNSRWKDQKRMRYRIPGQTVKAYVELINDPFWKRITNVCCTNNDIDLQIKRINTTIHARVK